jgi:predicted ATPase/DNA-binding SARP family transcriptional activator
VSSHWSLQTLGSLALTRDNAQLPQFQQGKGLLLLAYLSHRNQQSLPRDLVAKTLWGDIDLEHARNAFRVALSRLRKQLNEPDFFILDSHSIQLNSQFLTCDSTLFRQQLMRAKLVTEPNRTEAIKEALNLYKGPFLPNIEEAWVYSERQRLEEIYLKARSELATLYQKINAWDAAAEQWRLALECNALQEETHAGLIQNYRQAGRLSDAKEHYQKVLQLFREHRLAVSPRLQKALDAPLPALPELLVPVPPRTETPIPAQPVKTQTHQRLFGRAAELDLIHTQLQSQSEDTRLLSLVGTGGVGKTKLAQEALRMIPKDRVTYFVPLADVGVAEDVPEAILAAIRSQRAKDYLEVSTEPIRQLQNELGKQLGVLVLDNLEQLVGDHLAELLLQLLKTIPTLTILTTSRRRLGLDEEHVIEVLPLPVPETNTKTVEELESVSSVALFLERVRHQLPHFRLNRDNAEAVVALCRQVDGLPLALEMAAARMSVLSPAEISARIASRQQVLVSRRSDVAARHLSLRATFEWSYKLLAPATQAFLRGLSVFRGGWSLEAAEIVCEAPDALDLLMELHDASLLLVNAVDVSGKRSTRYRLLESVRQFLEERLASEERQRLEQKHSEWCVQLTPSLQGDNDLLSLEYENIFQMLQRPSHSPGDSERAALVRLLRNRWWSHPLSSHWTQHVLPFVEHLKAGGEHTEDRHHLLWGYIRKQINVARSLGDVDQELLSLFRRAQKPEHRVAEHQLRAALFATFGPLEEALQSLNSVVDEPGLNDSERCFGLMDLGWLLGRMGDFDAACRVMTEARALIQHRESQCWWAGSLECMSGFVELQRGRLPTARALIELGIQHLTDHGNVQLYNNIVPPLLGTLLLKEEKYHDATLLFCQHIKYFQAEDYREVIFSIRYLADCAIALKHPTLGLWLLAVWQAINISMHLVCSPHELEVTANLRATAEAAGADPSAWDAAIVLPYDDAIPLLLSKTKILEQTN